MTSRMLRGEDSNINFRMLTDERQARDYPMDEGGPHPKVVLLDLKLPLVSGLEVLEQLRQQNRLNTTPIVMFSSSIQDRDLRAAYSLGANSYLVKPQPYQDWQTMIR